jgi:RNA polymerase sigma-70 factor (ECF subfamily)
VIESPGPRIIPDVSLTLSMEGVPPLVAANRKERLQRLLESDYRFIWRLLRRLGVPSDAIGDATQQVFLIAAERLDDIVENSERSFAFGTALRVAQSVRRRVARESLSEPSDVCASSMPGQDELSDQKRARELLDRVLEEMPLDLRTVFILFELEGLRSPEIAELVGIPLGTAASRLRRARERFAALVAEHGPSPKKPGGAP